MLPVEFLCKHISVTPSVEEQVCPSSSWWAQSCKPCFSRPVQSYKTGSTSINPEFDILVLFVYPPAMILIT